MKLMILEGSLDFAFHEDFGYLTACPTNVNRAQASVISIYLLYRLRICKNLINGLNKIGLTVRGLYGEGTEAIGDLYQISNQMTLGEGRTDNKEIEKCNISNYRQGKGCEE